MEKRDSFMGYSDETNVELARKEYEDNELGYKLDAQEIKRFHTKVTQILGIMMMQILIQIQMQLIVITE